MASYEAMRCDATAQCLQVTSQRVGTWTGLDRDAMKMIIRQQEQGANIQNQPHAVEHSVAMQAGEFQSSLLLLHPDPLPVSSYYYLIQH